MAPLPRGAECSHAGRQRRGACGRAAHGCLWNHNQFGVCVGFLWGLVPVAASESQRPDDLMRRVQRRRSGARLAWGRWLRHCRVAVPESRGWGAHLLWLFYAGSLPFCCTCPGLGGVRVGEPDVGSTSYSSAGWYGALLPGLRCALPCPLGPGAPAAARGVWRQAPALSRLPACGTGGQSSHRSEGRPALGAPPPRPSVPGVGQSGPVANVRRARVCGRGVPALSPWRVCSSGGCAPRGWRRRVSQA